MEPVSRWSGFAPPATPFTRRLLVYFPSGAYTVWSEASADLVFDWSHQGATFGQQLLGDWLAHEVKARARHLAHEEQVQTFEVFAKQAEKRQRERGLVITPGSR